MSLYSAGFWWIEISYPYDTVSDNELIMQQLFEALIGIWDYMKNTAVKIHDIDTTNWAYVLIHTSGVGCSLPNWQSARVYQNYLFALGTYACKREARRMIGLQVQTQKDLIPEPTDWSDAVCHGGWPIDLHDPSGTT